MTIKRSKNPRREGEEEAEENNDHDDDDSSESSIDSSTESSSPLETETDDDGYQIRQHALELLESLPERGSSNPQQQSGNNNIVNGTFDFHHSYTFDSGRVNVKPFGN